MRKYFVLLLLVGIMSFPSCKKGCKEVDAINYDSDAKMNANCTFLSDPWIGTYSVTDSVVDDQFFGTYSYVSTYDVTISRIDGNIVLVSGLFKCTDGLSISAEKSFFDIAGKSFCDRTLFAHFILTNDGLQFDCRYDNATSSMTRRGKGIKQ